MTGLAAAAARLAETLVQENAALDASDLVGATRLLAEKNAALAAFTLARKQSGTADDPAMRLAATDLLALIGENRRLLERAIRVQARVIGTIARAVPRALARDARGYGRDGAVANGRHMQAVALSSNA